MVSFSSDIISAKEGCYHKSRTSRTFLSLRPALPSSPLRALSPPLVIKLKLFAPIFSLCLPRRNSVFLFWTLAILLLTEQAWSLDLIFDSSFSFAVHIQSVTKSCHFILQFSKNSTELYIHQTQISLWFGPSKVAWDYIWFFFPKFFCCGYVQDSDGRLHLHF